MSKPIISVLMSVYNTPESWLRDSIESICNQTFKDIEFIIILDKPTDNSLSIVKEYVANDDRIVIISNDTNLGLTKSLNKGLSIARGKYIARMDSDDVAFRNRLEKQFYYMETHPETVALGTQVCTSLDAAHVMEKFPVSDWTPDQDVLKIRMLFHNVGIPHPTAIFRHDVMIEHEIQYDERIKKSQDYKLWVDLMPYGNIDMLNEVLLMYRIHEGQISADRKDQYKYVHMIAGEQAQKLLGSMTNQEREIHNAIATMEAFDIKAYANYIQKLIVTNYDKKIYDQTKLIRELEYMWVRKAFRRAKYKKNFDMIFSFRTLQNLNFSILQYVKENKNIKEWRRKAFSKADYSQCVMR